MITGLLLRLLIAVLAYWIGEKVVSLLNNADLQRVLTIVLIVAIVLYVVLGSIWPIG